MSRPSSWPVNPAVALALACAVAAASPGVSRAQQPADQADDVVAPRGQQPPRDINYSGWRKLCFHPPGARMVCRTTASGTWSTGQVAVRVDLVEAENGRSRLQIFMPVGLYLPAGVKVAIDQSGPTQLPYSWCLANACIAADVIEANTIGAMESGQELKLEVMNSNILTLATTVPLNGFATAHKEPPAQVFEYQFDDD